MTADQQERFLTRTEVVELVRAELGVPLTISRFNKDAMNQLTPGPAAYYGKRQLYTRDAALQYGRTLLSTEPRRLRAPADIT